MKPSWRTAAVAAALPLAVGCRPFGWEEAETVARTNTDLTVAAYQSLSRDRSAAERRSTEALLDWEELEGGWSFSGSLTSDGPYWTGTMNFTGGLSTDEDWAEWLLSVDYIDVAYEEVVLAGAMDWRWEVERSGDTGFHMEYEVTGEITATGEVEGTGVIDYLATIDVDGTSASFTVSGEVGGTPVDYSLTVNLAFLS